MRYITIGRYIVLLDNIRATICSVVGDPDPSSNFEGVCVRNQIIISYVESVSYILDFSSDIECKDAFQILSDLLISS